MSLAMPGSYQSHTHGFHLCSNHSSHSSALSKSSYTTCGSEFIHVVAPRHDTEVPPSSGPSVNQSPKARHHPYPRQKTREHSLSESNHSPNTRPHRHDKERHQHLHNTTPRPNVFGAHTLLCGIKLSDTLIADHPPPEVDEYPTAPILSAYNTDGSLTNEGDAKAALELARAAQIAIQAHEYMLQAKIQEELVVLSVLQRKAESIASAARDAERQIGELTGMLNDQWTFSHKRAGEHMYETSDEEEESNDDDNFEGIAPFVPKSTVSAMPDTREEQERESLEPARELRASQSPNRRGIE